MTHWPVGRVHLNVANLRQSLHFYQQVIGLAVLDEQNSTVMLGTPGTATHLLTLTELRHGQQSQGGTGLYHFALLLPSRRELGRVLRHFAINRTPLQGLSDHLVSEAIYLADPEGNGIEIYGDRPRTEWPLRGSSVEMNTLPMDVESVLAEVEGDDQPFEQLPAETIMGHIHLHVAHLPQAQRFYGDLLGFEVMQQLAGSALFMSRAGYHHHLGLNTWRSGLPSPITAETLGLCEYVLDLSAEKPGVIARLEEAGIELETREDGVFLRDPAGNGVLLA